LRIPHSVTDKILTKDIYPSEEEIRQDLVLLSAQTKHIRTYSVKGTQADIPRIASELGMSVTQGIWLSNIEEDNEKEIARAIEVINASRNINLVVVGNESMYRREVDLPRLIEYIEQVRSQVKVPVTTAETWDIWLKYPQLVQHVDVVAAHILPFWEKNLPAHQ
jgi:exo-beta-1,3-glucanase (GH17 family)